MLRNIKLMVVALGFMACSVQSDQNNPELNHLFEMLHSANEPTEAMAITRQIWQNWYQSDNEQVEKLMGMGEVSMQRGELAEAIDYYTRVIELEPDFAEGWNRRATVYYMMGEYQLSTSDVTETLHLEPRHFGALSGQGMIYMQLREKELALEYYEKALDVNPHMSAVKQSIEFLKKLIEDEVI